MISKSTRSLTSMAAALAVVSLALPPSAEAARRSIDEHRPAEAQGQVEVIVVSGRISVVGWDKAEVSVTGSIGDSVEKLEVTSSGSRTTVRTINNHGMFHMDWGSNNSGDADLVIHVPRASSLKASLTSADLGVADLQGNQEIQTVSGDVKIAASREVRIGTVSGDVQLTAAPESKVLEISTVSGDLHVSGGGGEVSVTTVSGDGIVSVGTATRLHLKTVSGDFQLTTGLTSDGRLDAESVSGDLTVTFTGGVPPADFDVQSFSGDLTTCFGQKPTHERYGPGARLEYKEGAGTARVKIDTKSGDVGICTKR